METAESRLLAKFGSFEEIEEFVREGERAVTTCAAIAMLPTTTPPEILASTPVMAVINFVKKRMEK